jgi:transcriptional regulator with XRE-family HTH domain
LPIVIARNGLGPRGVSQRPEPPWRASDPSLGRRCCEHDYRRAIYLSALFKARHAAHLTQEQLGRRLGLKGSAIYRWECGHSEPAPRHRRALVLALRTADPGMAAQLDAALELHDGGNAAPALTLAEARAALAGSGGSLEILVFRMANELDLPPRRVRGACARLLRSLRAAHLTVERAEKELEEWMNRVA